jgi:hypothetical protein
MMLQIEVEFSAMQERRRQTRGRSFLGGRIIFNNRSSSVDCLIRDMSPKGARVRLSMPVMIPDEFELLIPKQGRSFQARVAWRMPDEFGIAFLDDKNQPASLELTLQLRKLEAEKTALRARVEQLSCAE